MPRSETGCWGLLQGGGDGGASQVSATWLVLRPARGDPGPRGLEGNNRDSLDPGLLPRTAQAFPGDQRGFFAYLANLWREAGGRDGRGGTASGDGGRGGGS